MASLTPRQLRAAELIAGGVRPSEAARMVGVDASTVRRWRKRQDFRDALRPSQEEPDEPPRAAVARVLREQLEAPGISPSKRVEVGLALERLSARELDQGSECEVCGWDGARSEDGQPRFPPDADPLDFAYPEFAETYSLAEALGIQVDVDREPTRKLVGEVLGLEPHRACLLAAFGVDLRDELASGLLAELREAVTRCAESLRSAVTFPPEPEPRPDPPPPPEIDFGAVVAAALHPKAIPRVS